MISAFFAMQRVTLLTTNTQGLPLNAAYISFEESRTHNKVPLLDIGYE
jgi:hypothetical protein